MGSNTTTKTPADTHNKMTDLVSILLALITVGVSVVAAALGYIIRQLQKIKREDIDPMKQKVETMWNTFFGVEDSEGFLEETIAQQTRMKEMIEETKEQQNQAHSESQEAFAEILLYLRRLSRELRRQNVEAPHPDEELDDNEFLSGND